MRCPQMFCERIISIVHTTYLLTYLLTYFKLIVCSYQVSWSRSSSQCYDRPTRTDSTPQTAGTLIVDSYGSTSIAGTYSNAHLLRGHVTSGERTMTSRGTYAATLPRSAADYLGLGGLDDSGGGECPSPLCVVQHHHHCPTSAATSAISQSRDIAVPDVTSSPRRCRLHMHDCPPTAVAV